MGACLKVTEAGPGDACTIRRMDHAGTHIQPPSTLSVLLVYQCGVPSAGGQIVGGGVLCYPADAALMPPYQFNSILFVWPIITATVSKGLRGCVFMTPP